MALWKRAFKWLAWLMAGALMFVVVAYLALVAINWKDRAPSAGATRLAAMYRNRPAVADGENGYVYTMGFTIARDGDPRVAGVRRIEWLRNIPDAAEYPLSGDPAPDDQSYSSRRSPAAKAIVEACRFVTRECAVAFETADEAMRDWLQSEQWLVERYMALLRHEGWLETVPFDARAALPSFGMVFDGQKMLLAKAAMLASQSDAAGVRSLLASDVRFWREVLASSDTVLTKMIAVAALRRTFGVGNLVLRRLPPELAMEGMPQEWLIQISDEERSLMRCLVGEWVSADRTLRQAASGSWTEIHAGVASNLLDRMLRPLFQFQDSSNRRAEMFIQMADALNVPFDQFPAALERTRVMWQVPGEDALPIPTMYNPIGDVLLWISSPAYHPYAARVVDLEGIRRAAVLTAELRSRKVPVAQVPAELAASQIRGPYSAEPFAWDAEEAAIVFTGLEPAERGRHAFKY